METLAVVISTAPGGQRPVPATQMGVHDFFPSDLRILTTMELMVLHSRAHRALESAGSHRELDQEIAFRLEELREELDVRDAEAEAGSIPRIAAVIGLEG